MANYAHEVIIDEDGAWTAAAYLASDPACAGTQHGMADSGTLCGLSGEEVVVVRNPFYGTAAGDCESCADALRRLARQNAPEAVTESTIELGSLHMGPAGSVIGWFNGSEGGSAEIRFDRSGPIVAGNAYPPPPCLTCGHVWATAALDRPTGLTAGFATAGEVHDLFGRARTFQEATAVAVETVVPRLRALVDGLRNRIGMYTPTHHFVAVSNLVQGFFIGAADADLDRSVQWWVSREIGHQHNQVHWIPQIVAKTAPEFYAGLRDPGLGFMTLPSEDSDRATSLMLDLLDGFCDFAEQWRVETGIEGAAER